jgi:hypothetical protein
VAQIIAAAVQAWTHSNVKTIPTACPTRSGRAGVALASRYKVTMGYAGS